MKRIGLFLLLLVFVVFVSGCVDSPLKMDIISSKDVYERGELVEGEYYVEYRGEPFEAIIFYGYSREGFDELVYHSSYKTITEGNTTKSDDRIFIPYQFESFKRNENGYSANTGYFIDEGEYSYHFLIYNCDDIADFLESVNTTCKESQKIINKLLVDGKDDIMPMKSISKTITVSGGEVVSECKDSEDCVESCENCEDGTLICSQGKEICIECITDTNCKDGYNCNENLCEPEE
jgi:hypothetical protein